MADKVVTGLYLFIYFFKGVKEVNHSQTCPNQKRVESKKKDVKKQKHAVYVPKQRSPQSVTPRYLL